MTHHMRTPKHFPAKSLASAKPLVLTGAGIALAIGLAGCTTMAPRDEPYYGPYDTNSPYSQDGDYSVDGDMIPGAAQPGYAGPQAVRPRRIGGEIDARDFPANSARDREGRSALFHMTIATDGRVTDCRAQESSGIVELDDFTCRLIMRRFRYEPARDAQGRPVDGIAGWRQRWFTPARR